MGLELYIYRRLNDGGKDLMWCAQDGISLKDWWYFIKRIWKDRKQQGSSVRYFYEIHAR